ncbi:MAG: polysaccharide biosynthesis C-terminal domain-containing protein [Bacteroidales bacterium]
MKHPIKSLIGQTAIYGLSSILGRFLNYLLVPLYTSLFVPSEYGVVSEMYAYVSIFMVILTYGMETGFFRFSQNTEYDKNSVYSTAMFSLVTTSVIFVILIFFTGGFISGLMGYSRFPEYIVLLGFTIALDAVSALPFAKLRNENRARRFAIIKFINIGVNIGFNLFFLVFLPEFFGTDNFIYNIVYPNISIGYIFISNFLASLVTLLFLIPEFYSVSFKNHFDRLLLKKLLIYSLPLLLAGMAGMISENFDRILIKYLTSVPAYIVDKEEYIMAQVGIYGANVKIAVLMTLFIQAYRYAAEPFFFSNAKNKESKRLYAMVMDYFVFFGLFVFVLITLFIDFTKYIIDSSYHEGLGIVPVLLIGKIFFGIAFNLSIWYKLTNRTNFGALLAFIEVIVSVLLNILLIPVFGYFGSAWAAASAYFFMMFVSFWLGNKYYPIKYNYLKVFAYFLIAICIYLINLYLRNTISYYLVANLFMIMLFLALFIYIEKFNLSNLVKIKSNAG